MHHLLSLDWELKNMSGGMKRCTVGRAGLATVFPQSIGMGSFF